MLSSRRTAQLGLCLCGALFVGALSILAIGAGDGQPRPGQVATAAPDFTLADTHGGKTRLSQYRGQVVILAFTSVRDMDSSEADSAVAQLCTRFADYPRVRVLRIDANLDQAECPSTEELVLRDRIACDRSATLVDGRGKVARSFGVKDLPSVVIVDAQGLVRRNERLTESAPVSTASCEDTILALLSESNGHTAFTQALARPLGAAR